MGFTQLNKYITGALTQFTLRNYTAKRLREGLVTSLTNLSMWLQPQWMHWASVSGPGGRRLGAGEMGPSLLLTARVCSSLKVRSFTQVSWT